MISLKPTRVVRDGSSGNVVGFVNQDGGNDQSQKAEYRIKAHGSLCKCWVEKRGTPIRGIDLLLDLISWISDGRTMTLEEHSGISLELRKKYGMTVRVKQ